MILKSFYIFWLLLCMHGGGANPVISYRSDTQWTQCDCRSFDGLSNIWTIALQKCHFSLATHCNYNVLTIMCVWASSDGNTHYSELWNRGHRAECSIVQSIFYSAISSSFLTVFMTVTRMVHFSLYVDDSQPNDCFTSTQGYTHEHIYTCTDIMSDSHRHKHTDTHACTLTHPHTWTYNRLHTHACVYAHI